VVHHRVLVAVPANTTICRVKRLNPLLAKCVRLESITTKQVKHQSLLLAKIVRLENTTMKQPNKGLLAEIVLKAMNIKLLSYQTALCAVSVNTKNRTLLKMSNVKRAL
jgi:hypothetical protein